MQSLVTISSYLIANLGPIVDPDSHGAQDGAGQPQLDVPHPHALLAALQQHLEEDVGEPRQAAARDHRRQAPHRALC